MKDKEKQIKDLTWKYFRQQKAKEIGESVLVILKALMWAIGIIAGIGVVLLISALFGYLFNLWGWLFCNPTFFEYIANGFGGMLLFCLFGVLIVLIFAMIQEWLQDNWKKAKAKAKKEVNKK